MNPATMTKQPSGALERNVFSDGFDMINNGSSSLSELDAGEISEDADTPRHRSQIPAQLNAEADSEAETERLEKSPQKNERPVAVAIVNDEQAATEALLGLSNSIPATTADAEPPVDIPSSSPRPALDSSPSAPSEGTNLGKRKRVRVTESPLSDEPDDEPEDEPLPKRTLTTVNTDTAEPGLDVHMSGDASNSEGLAMAEKPTARPGRPQSKGKRRTGLSEAAADVSDTPLADAEEAVEEVEEEEEAVEEEESAKRKEAGDALITIERGFLSFRQKFVAEQLEQVDMELELLNKPDSSHPEFVKMMAAVNQRRDDKIKYENTLLKFDLTTLARTTSAERHQIYSQYTQEVRRIREEALEKCNKELYAVQRERRRFGAHEKVSQLLYNPSRQDQSQAQTSYNKEVSILAGVSKNVGFPAAPDLVPCTMEDRDRDFQVMGIESRAATAANQAISTPSESRAAAEEQFLERTPWANPQHPAHGESMIGFGGPRRLAESPPVPSAQLVATIPEVQTVTANSTTQASTTVGNSQPVATIPGVQTATANPANQVSTTIDNDSIASARTGWPGNRIAPMIPITANPHLPFSAAGPGAPSFHVFSRNKLFSVPITGVVHPTNGQKLKYLSNPDGSPLNQSPAFVPITPSGLALEGPSGPTIEPAGLPRTQRSRGKRPPAGTVIIIKEFDSFQNSGSTNATKSANKASKPEGSSTRPRSGTAKSRGGEGIGKPGRKRGASKSAAALSASAKKTTASSSVSVLPSPRGSGPAGHHSADLIPSTPPAPMTGTFGRTVEISKEMPPPPPLYRSQEIPIHSQTVQHIDPVAKDAGAMESGTSNRNERKLPPPLASGDRNG